MVYLVGINISAAKLQKIFELNKKNLHFSRRFYLYRCMYTSFCLSVIGRWMLLQFLAGGEEDDEGGDGGESVADRNRPPDAIQRIGKKGREK